MTAQPLPFGARSSLAGAQLDEPMVYFSAAQAPWCVAQGFGAWVPHLPCWVPQRQVSVRLYGADGLALVEASVAAHGPWVWATEFSNVHSTFACVEPSIVVDGAQCAGVEVYFQREKSRGTRDEAAAREAFASCTDPAEAWRLARRFAMRPDWATARVDVMRAAVRAKFTQHAGLAALLRATGTHPLVQLKRSDAVWGTGPDGRGDNLLGVLLMALRAELAQ